MQFQLQCKKYKMESTMQSMFDQVKEISQKFIASTIGRVTIVLGFVLIFFWYFFLSDSSQESREDHVYRIASDGMWYPEFLMGKEKNMSVFSNELLIEIAKRQNFKIELAFAKASNLFKGLENEDYDGVLASLRSGVQQKENFYTSDLYYLLGAVLIVQAHSDVQSLADLSGKTVGIRAGYPTPPKLQQYPSVLVRYYENMSQALADLNNNSIAGIIMETVPAYAYTSAYYRDTLKVLTPQLTHNGLSLITLKTEQNQWLIDQFNAGLKAIKEDGTYEQLLYKWDLYNPIELEK